MYVLTLTELLSNVTILKDYFGIPYIGSVYESLDIR